MLNAFARPRAVKYTSRNVAVGRARLRVPCTVFLPRHALPPTPMLDPILNCLAAQLTPPAMLFMFVGVIHGLVIGILPGLGGVVARTRPAAQSRRYHRE